jgi:hypothetical protein
MTDHDAIADIIGQYVKHGWKLRRVLLTAKLSVSLGDAAGLFGDAELKTSDHDGLWFSRRSMPDREAWELRRISASPFALVEVIPDGVTDQERDGILAEAEGRMFDPARPKEISH